MMRFRKDESARVPFAVIGIFLIFISTIASINLNRLDIKMAKTTSSSSEVTSADTAIQYARADIARAINYAGMDALKSIGETPVIRQDNNSEYYGDPEEFNKNRVKGMINHTLNQYIEANYMHDAFAHDGYSINVDALRSWKDLEIEPVRMKLNRSLNPPVLKPGEGYAKGYETYWKISVPLKVHIKNLDTKSELMSEPVTMETITTSRYPLLKDLADEYSQRLNGGNAAMVETTAFAEAYTWARGYMQYAGYPENENIVDNEHLAQIVNGAVLLDQGFVFNSLDPMSIVAFVKASGQKEYKDISLEGGSLKIDPMKDAFNSTGNPARAEQEFNKVKQFDFNATLVADFINNRTLEESEVSRKIDEISKSVYSGSIKTIVSREQVVTSRGKHADHPIDRGIVGTNSISEPVKDEAMSANITRDTNLSPGVLYGEVWKVDWRLRHKWRKTWTETVPCGESTCTVTRHHDMITNDYQTDTVTFKIYAVQDSYYEQVLNYAKTRQSRYNDLNNAFTRQDVKMYKDLNLEDVPESYRSNYFTADIRRNYILQFGFTDPNGVREASIDGFYDAWLKEEAEAAVDDIRNKINDEVHLDPGINYVAYPVPSDLLNASKEDLISKIERNESRYVDRARYMTGSRYSSAGAKVISLVREWYVDEVKYQILMKHEEASEQIDNEIQNQFKGNTEDIKTANNDAVKFLSGGLKLPVGFAMEAYHVDENGTAYPEEDINAWNESVTLSIDQEPDYLFMDASESNKELITLGMRNINIFGPTGLPVLPSMNPWLAQFNAWQIEVQGKINKFEVQDVDDEVHPNAIFGHEAQVYVRKNQPAVIDDLTGLPIGKNLPIKFSFTTGTFILVPPGKTIGDREGGVSEESPYFGKII